MVRIEEYGIVAIGDDEFVLGFRMAGVYKVITNKNNFEQELFKLLNNKTLKIVVVEDKDLDTLHHNKRVEVLKHFDPVVIPLGKGGEEEIREKIRKAVGIDVYSTKK